MAERETETETPNEPSVIRKNEPSGVQQPARGNQRVNEARSFDGRLELAHLRFASVSTKWSSCRRFVIPLSGGSPSISI